MTSMPASRSARATTFAPRSWPSSPGFATTTLIRASICDPFVRTTLTNGNPAARVRVVAHHIRIVALRTYADLGKHRLTYSASHNFALGGQLRNASGQGHPIWARIRTIDPTG